MKKEKKQQLVGQIKPHRGHTLFKYHKETDTLVKMGPVALFTKVEVEEGYVYIAALNEKNARKKVLQTYKTTQSLTDK